MIENGNPTKVFAIEVNGFSTFDIVRIFARPFFNLKHSKFSCTFAKNKSNV